MKNILLTLTGFQITWILSILGEFFNYPYIGLFAGLVYLYLFFNFSKNKLFALKICFTFALIGYSFDTYMAYLNYYYINSSMIIGYLPIWFLTLWPSFTTLFVTILIFLRNKYLISFMLGGLFGPLTYYTGFPIGLAESSNLNFSLFLMFIFWGLFLTLYCYIITNKKI